MGVRVSRPLCRDPHVLLDADAELDLDLVVVVDLDPLHQPGNDHVLSLVEGVRPGQQVGHFLGGSLSSVLFLLHLCLGLFHPTLGCFRLFLEVLLRE